MKTNAIHVACNVPVGGDGSEQRPFDTLHHALDALVGSKDKAEVMLHEGTYYLDEPLEIGQKHVGAGLTIGPWQDQAVTVSGGIHLDGNWEPYRNGILMCRLPGLKHHDFSQLYVNGDRMTRARYPDAPVSDEKYAGCLHPTAAIASDVPSPVPDADEDMTFAHTPPRGIEFKEADFAGRRWAHPETGVIHIFQAYRWGNLQWRVNAVDWENRRIWFGEGGYQIGAQWVPAPCHVSGNSPFYVENIFEELDSPGEWFFDRETATLYFYPLPGMNMQTALVEGSCLKQLIRIVGTQAIPVRNVRIHGIRFAHAEVTYLDEHDVPSLGDWSIHRGGAVFLEGTRNVEVSDCLFDALGGNAVFVNRYNRDAVITGNLFRKIGESAICFVGDHYKTIGTRRCFPYECRAENNHVHHCGIFGKQTAAVYISRAKRITAGHNLVHHMPRAGICIGDGTWGGHVIEYNHIHHTCLETMDHGPFNAWGRERDWCRIHSMHGKAAGRCKCHGAGDIFIDAMETVVVRNNCFEEKSGWGLDLDDGASNYDVYNNICIGVSMKLREGAYRTVHNNIWVDSVNPVGIHVGNVDNHDRYFNNITVIGDSGEKPEEDFHFAMSAERGQIYSLICPPDEGPLLEEVDRNCFWSNLGHFIVSVRYRKPSGEKDDPTARYSLEKWREMGFDRNSVFADPMFVDPEKKDYRVKPESPALKVGFKNFEMGLWGLTDKFAHTVFERWA